MAKRVNALTDEQRARMPEWRDKWIDVGLRTGPSDRWTFVQNVRRCYEAADLTPPAPDRIVWVASPLQLAFAAPAAALLIELRKSVPIDATIGEETYRAIGDAVRAVAKQVWSSFIGGQFWVGGWYWGSPSYVSFMRDVCGLELEPKLAAAADAYRACTESACWWWPHRDFVMVSERPVWIDRDERGRLHSTTRQAISWPDGWGVYQIHGVTVPADLVTAPESLTVSRIDAESNAEVRHTMLELYGLRRYVEDSNSEVLDEDRDTDDAPRRLLRHRGMLFLQVANSTPEHDGSRKTYLLAAHPELRPIPPAGSSLPLGAPQKLTCANAVASLHYLRGPEYRPEVET